MKDEVINYRKLNNYDLETDYDDIVRYKTTGNTPNKLDADQEARFIEKYKPFKVRNNKLYYSHLEVIKKKDIAKTLQPIYEDPSLGLGNGITRFYYIVVNNYLNITREDAQAFLKRQSTYQLTYKPRKKKQELLKYNAPHIAYAMDLIDISRYSTHNKNYKFLLTMVDVYSQQVWIRKLKNKEAVSINAELIKIFEVQQPKIMLMDNGGEFKGINLDLFKQLKIKILNTPSHTPQPNIEQLNSSVRRMISQILVHFAGQGNTFDYITYIGDIEDNINHSNALAVNVRKREKKANLRRATPQVLIKAKFKIGDKVRIIQAAIESQVRKQNKQNLQKYQHVKYSLDVFEVIKIYKPQNKANALPFYVLQFPTGEQVVNNSNDKLRRFKENELLIVPANTVGSIPTEQQNDKLNGITGNAPVVVPNAQRNNQANEEPEEEQVPTKRITRRQGKR